MIWYKVMHILTFDVTIAEVTVYCKVKCERES